MTALRAAMMYQHATAQASRLIADSLSGMIQRTEPVVTLASRTSNGTLMA